MPKTFLQAVALLCVFAQTLVGLAPAGTVICFHGSEPVGLHLHEDACSTDQHACGGESDRHNDEQGTTTGGEGHDGGLPAEHPAHGHAAIPASSARLDSQRDLSFAIAAVAVFEVVCTDLPLVPLVRGEGRRVVPPDEGVCHSNRVSTQKLLI